AGIRPLIHNFTAADTLPWMVVQYVPSLGTGGTSASIAYIVASSMTFLVNDAAPAGADAIGATGVILTSSSTYNTMGELVDYINGRIAWRAYLVGALRADLSSLMLVKSATICSGANGLTFYADSSNSDDHSFAISGEKFVSNAVGGHVTDADDYCENEMLYGAFTVTSASDAIELRYYSGKQGDTETQVGSAVAVTTATLKEQGEVNLTVPFVQATRGQRLIMRVVDTSTTPG
ncbi:unnamed protein product, partial [marine sediment metagenome]